jgi:hypothetical protein
MESLKETFVEVYRRAVTDPNFVFPEPLVSKVWGEYGDYQLVGHNPAVTNERCGKHVGLVVCSNLEGHDKVTLDGLSHKGKVAVKHVFNYCNSYGCPSCFMKGAVYREAKRAEARLLEGKKSFGLVEHLTVGISPSLYGLSMEVLRKRFKKALVARGVIGGAIIEHAFRYHNREEARRKGGLMGWYFSIHMHVLGYISGGSYVRCRLCRHNCNADRRFCLSCDGFEGVTRRHWKEDGFIVKVARDKKGVAGERRSVFKTLQYILSHCSIKKSAKRAHPLTWFGVVSYRKMSFKYVTHKDGCWICGGEMKPSFYVGSRLRIVKDASSPDFKPRFEADYLEDGVVVWVEKECDRFGRFPSG